MATTTLQPTTSRFLTISALISASALTFSLGIPRINPTEYVGSNELKIEEKKEKEYIRNCSLSTSYHYSLFVSSSFKTFLLRKYDLDLSKKQDLADFKLMAYLLPGGHRVSLRSIKDDPESTAIYAGREFIRDLIGANKDNNFSSSEVLERFSTKYWALDWIDGTRGGTSRRIVSVKYPSDVLCALVSDFDSDAEKKDLITGRTPLAASESPIMEVEEIRQYLAGLRPAVFQPILTRVPKASAFIDAQKSGDWNVLQKCYQRAHLSATRVNPVPNYTSVAKTSRLYASGSSWILTSKPVRNILTQDYWKFDLAQAQLRIAGALWELDLKPYQHDGSVWKYLLRYLGVSAANVAVKDDLKTYVYAAIFGYPRGALACAGTALKGKKRVKMRTLRPFNSKLIRNPLIVELLAVRDRVQGRLLAGETIEDAWGQSHRVSSPAFVKGREANKKDRVDESKSIMACVCQSYELALLKPLFDYVQDKEIQVIGLLHDGVWGAGDWQPHVETVCRLVRERGVELLGVDTPLEATPPKG